MIEKKFVMSTFLIVLLLAMQEAKKYLHDYVREPLENLTWVPQCSSHSYTFKFLINP